MAGGFLNFYQHIPEHIDPTIFSAGFFSFKWYSLGYLAGFLVVYLLLRYRMKNGEFQISSAAADKFQNKSKNLKSKNFIFDLLLYLFVGLLIGARLGYVVFYNLEYFLQNPLEIFLPIRVMGYGLQVTGIHGMSYFGGLSGAILAGWIFARKNKINPVEYSRSECAGGVFNRVNFVKLADFVIPAIPAGYFFGRIGNFLNGELYGRTTDQPWGMYFPADSDLLLRHPSQLYEAFFEGLVLFTILWAFRNGIRYKNKMFQVPCFMLYVSGYAFFRFFIEFFREPDQGAELFFSFLTKGQILSIILAAISCAVFIIQKRKNSV